MKKYLLLIGLILIIIIAMNVFLHFQVNFDKIIWNEADGVTKYRMAMNLKTSKLLVGKKRVEVVTLLGKPQGQDNNNLYYKVEPPFGYKDNFTILFANHKVIDVYLND